MIKILLPLLIVVLISCNEGLAPPPAISPSYIKGNLTYKGGKSKWPPSDSVKDIRVVAFRNYPPKDVVSEVTNGTAFFTDSKLKFVDSDTFSIVIAKPPLDIQYLVVAQNYGTILQWHAIGVYSISGDNTKPTTINITPGKVYNADINIDFDNLPPQPFN